MLGVAIGLLAVVGCGDSGSPNSPSASTPQRGAVTDPAGDSLSTSSVAISPDLVAGTVDVSDGSLTLTLSFARGTLSQTDTLFHVQFDTDEDPATGFPGEPGLFGLDYFVRAVIPRNSNQATVQRIIGSAPCSAAAPCPVVGNANVTFPTADQARVTIPLALFGNDDGRMTFKVIVEQWLSDTAISTVLDIMPDRGQPPGIIR